MPSSSANLSPFPNQDPADERSQRQRVRNLRSNVQAVFTGRGRNGAMEGEESTNNEIIDGTGNRGDSEGPKTPRFTITMPNLPSTRLVIPYLRSSTNAANRSSPADPDFQGSSEPMSNVSSALPSPSIIPSRQPSTEPLRNLQQAQIPERVVTRDDRRDRWGRQNRRDRGDGPRLHSIGFGPEERELDDLAARSRRRRERRKRRPAQGGRSNSSFATASSSSSASPSQDLVRRKRKAVKSKVISCVASGLFLTVLLCIYLALALSNKIASQEFHVVIILIILVTTVYFCHSLIRLCVLLMRPASDFAVDTSTRHYNVNQSFARGYANPSQPIRVQLLRDEEAAGIESDVTKFPPPAYGLWRESVRVDPNRIFWARNEEETPDVPEIPSQHSRGNGDSTGPNGLERTITANRPPSYISEDGVEYVIEARGRSIAPPEPDTEISMEHANEISHRMAGVSSNRMNQTRR